MPKTLTKPLPKPLDAPEAANPYFQAPIPWTPHLGQRKGVKFLLEHAAAGMFASPGAGKTTMVLAAFKMLQKRGLASKMLVIAPLRPVYLVWGQEVAKWLDFSHFKVAILHGPKKDKALASEADIYLINPEGLSWLLGTEKVEDGRGRKAIVFDLKKFRELGFDTLVVDELSAFKNSSSARFKTIKQVLGTFSRRWGLTGSPAANGLIDLFGQCYVLDQGRTLGPYVTHFRNKYFVPGYDGFTWYLKKNAEEQIYERLRPLVLRFDAADYVDMPEMSTIVRTFELPPEIRTLYDQLEDDLLGRIEDKIVVAANAGAAAMKCRQVVSGGIYLDKELTTLIGNRATKLLGQKREWAFLHDIKTDLVSDLVDELQGSPLLLAYEFHHDLARLQTRFGKDVPYIGGGVSARRAVELEKAWNAGELPLLLGHPASIGHGLNLQKAGNHVCWYSLTYDYDHYDQFNRRVWRQGNKLARVFVHHLVAKNTIDEKQLWALRHKEKRQDALFEALKEMRRTRK